MHIDLVGPLPQSLGFTHLLTCVDRFTQWPEVIPLSSITAEAVARAFMSGWISRLDMPDTVVTDRGAQFESHFWRSQACSHHCVSPPGQWHGGTVPSPALGLSTSRRVLLMDGFPPTCAARHTHYSKGGRKMYHG